VGGSGLTHTGSSSRDLAIARLDDPAAWLCHYTRAETAFAHILPRGRLLMNPYSRMRDPHENKRPRFRSAGASGDTDSETLGRLFWAVQREVGRSRDEWRLLSFTEGDTREPDRVIERCFRCPWSRPRMWEQYADNHAGACLIFDRAELLSALHHDLAAGGRYWEGAVDYTVAGFATCAAGTILLDQFDESSLKDDVAQHVVKHYRDFFFLKTEDWATEFEYRFVFKRAFDPPVPRLDASDLVSYGNALRHIVVGEKFPAWQLPGAREVAERAGVELRQMKWELSRPYPAKISDP
jgi:hypothetical protein